MGFLSYEGVPDKVLDQKHTTSTGETYTLRHNENLKVEMQYLGKGNSSSNSQGWERNSNKYFEALYQNHPEMFSKKNVARIQDKKAPIVDQKMISHNPEWAQYRNQSLVHHHIGGDGEAVAVPKNAHKGQGEIHNVEKAAGITDNCKKFSNNCSKQTDSVGKTSSELHMQLSAQQNIQKDTKGSTDNKTQRNDGSKTADTAKTRNSINTRSDSVRNNNISEKNTMSSRSDSVRESVSASEKTDSTDRSDSVKSVSSNDNTSSSTSRSASAEGKSHSPVDGNLSSHDSSVTRSKESSNSGHTSSPVSSSSSSSGSSGNGSGHGSSSSGGGQGK